MTAAASRVRAAFFRDRDGSGAIRFFGVEATAPRDFGATPAPGIVVGFTGGTGAPVDFGLVIKVVLGGITNEGRPAKTLGFPPYPEPGATGTPGRPGAVVSVPAVFFLFFLFRLLGGSGPTAEETGDDGVGADAEVTVLVGAARLTVSPFLVD